MKLEIPFLSRLKMRSLGPDGNNRCNWTPGRGLTNAQPWPDRRELGEGKVGLASWVDIPPRSRNEPI
jgi:hypothetical protein